MKSGAKKILILIGGLALALVLVWSFIGAGPALFARERQNGWSYHSGRLGPGVSIGQTFICREPGLARIDVRLGTYGLPLPQGVELRLVEIKDNLPGPLARPPLATDGGMQVEVVDGDQLGQTFIPGRPGLNGLWLEVDSRRLPPGARVVVELWQAGRFQFLGRKLARRVLAAETLPKMGTTRVDLEIPLPEAANLVGKRLLFTVHTKGAPRGRGLRLRFISEGNDWVTIHKASRLEACWLSNRTGNGKGGLPLTWYQRLGQLVFRASYPASMPEQPVIRKVRLSGYNMIDNGFSGFEFKPIADSKGKRYYLTLYSTGQGRGITALVDRKARYPYGRLVMDGVPIQGSLAFRAYTQRDKKTAAGRLLTRLTKNKPLFWAEGSFLICLLMAVSLLLGLVLALILMTPGGGSAVETDKPADPEQGSKAVSREIEE